MTCSAALARIIYLPGVATMQCQVQVVTKITKKYVSKKLAKAKNQHPGGKNKNLEEKKPF